MMHRHRTADLLFLHQLYTVHISLSCGSRIALSRLYIAYSGLFSSLCNPPGGGEVEIRVWLRIFDLSDEAPLQHTTGRSGLIGVL